MIMSLACSNCLFLKVCSCMQTVQVTLPFLGAVTALSWVCTLPTTSPTLPSAHDTSGSNASVTTATNVTHQHLLTRQQLSGFHGELAASLSRLPLNLVIVRPDSTSTATAMDSVHARDSSSTLDGERETVYDNRVDEEKSLKLTAAKRKTEWGPLITHCYSCYWKCVLFALKHLHSPIDRNRIFCGASYYSPTTKGAQPTYYTSCSSSSKTDSQVGSSIDDMNKAVFPIGSNDMNVVIGACLNILDMLDSEVPIVIQCLSLLLPKVYTYVRIYLHSLCSDMYMS